jgi:hypothetical protein
MIPMPQLRFGLGIAGLVAAVGAVALDSRAAAWVAVVLLGAAVLVRLVAARQARAGRDDGTS